MNMRQYLRRIFEALMSPLLLFLILTLFLVSALHFLPCGSFVDHEEAVLVGVVAVCMLDASHAT